MERWDAYYRDETKAGFDLVRGENIPDGIFHLIADVVVRHVDGDYLLVQRDWNKDYFPGAFEIGAGGSVVKGETPIEGAKRELWEETGIVGDNFTELYHICNEKHGIYYGYLCVTDCPKDSIVLREGETIDYKWVSREEFIAFVDSIDCIVVQVESLKGFIDSIR